MLSCPSRIFFSAALISQIAPKAVCRICTVRILLCAVAVCKLKYQIKVTTIPAHCSVVRSWTFAEEDIEEQNYVIRHHLQSLQSHTMLCFETSGITQPPYGTRLMMTTPREDCASSPHHRPTGHYSDVPKTFGSSCMSLKISSLLPQTDSRSLPPQHWTPRQQNWNHQHWCHAIFDDGSVSTNLMVIISSSVCCWKASGWLHSRNRSWYGRFPCSRPMQAGGDGAAMLHKQLAQNRACLKMLLF